MSYSIRPAVQRMRPYPPGRPIEEVQRELGLSDLVKLASNENPLGPSPRAVEAAKRAAETMNVYPDARSYRLRATLAERNGLTPDHVLLGCGSDEIIGILGDVFLEPGREMVMGDPSFIRYEAAAQVNGAKLVKVPLTADYRHDLPAMAAAVTPDTRMVFVANPNNPTGTIVSGQELEAFVDALPGHVLVVLDEAYFEFADGDEGHVDGLSLLRSGRRVAVLRTFSKAYGLAGIRVGFGFADPEVVQAFESARSPFDVNSLAQEAALAALDDVAHLAETVRSAKEGRRRIEDFLTGQGFEVIPSHANFVCFDTGGPAADLAQELLHQGVIVRPCTALGLPRHIRVSVGTPSEVDRFVQAVLTTTKGKVTA
ncbi:MAG: histidinol-phosphate transaminase [Armatimonadetes bacterium]|nr:histidinol-phosphate transaminase [Armatimonadota bacterium]